MAASMIVLVSGAGAGKCFASTPDSSDDELGRGVMAKLDELAVI